MSATNHQNRSIEALRLEALELKVAALEAANAALREENVALRQATIFLDAVVENLPNMVFVKDAAELRFLLFNRASEDILGIKRSEMLGLNDHDLFPRAQADHFTNNDRSVLESGESMDIAEEPINTPHRGRRILHTRKVPILDEHGDPLYLLGIAEDITDLKQTHEHLEGARTRLGVLLEHFPGAVWTTDEDFTLTSSGGSHAEIIGLTDPTIMGQPMASFARCAGEVPNLYQKALEGTVGHYEFEREGHTYEVVLQPLEGRKPGVLAIAIDATVRRRLEAERFEARLKESQQQESLGVLAAGIAHDFNNLLASIMGNAGMALLKLPADVPARDFVTRVESAAERAAELTRQLLAYSGKGHFVIQSVDLSQVVEDTADLLQVSISQNATLSLICAPSLPPIEVDLAQLQQVVLNLITNASDALEGADGDITLRTGVIDAAAGDLTSDFIEGPLPLGAYVWLEVQDTGVGMTPETRAHMFDPFYTTKPTGHGLGLAAILGIIRGHQGTLQVDSVPGEGTRIRVLFPASSGGAIASVIPTAPTKRRSGTILVVDDEESLREFAMEALQFGGYDVALASNGADAVAMVKAFPYHYDAVLLDLTMPGMDGDEVFEIVREVRPDLPVLISSGYTNHEITLRFADRGRSDFLPKPYPVKALLDAMKRLLGEEEAVG